MDPIDSLIRSFEDERHRLPLQSRPRNQWSYGSPIQPLSKLQRQENVYSSPSFSHRTHHSNRRTGGILSYYDSLERPLDAFDQELLNENVQGQQRRCDSSNRVSLASKYFDTGEDSGISPRAWGPAQQPKLPDSVRDTIQGSKHGLSNFTNHTRVESSSDYGPLSSPTYRASQKQSSTHIPPKTEYFPRPSELYSPSATRGAASKAHIESTGRNFDISAKVSGFRELRTKADRTSLPHANTPLIQGIRLVSLNELPDRFRSIFPFPIFNAVQSKCFNTVYKSRDNLVLSAPTGSGKTAIFEIAICSLIASSKNEEYKIVYQAPTKSLCSQRYRDWQSKFATLGLRCAELTGDTEYSNLQNVQSANIIIITPEKWDSITRKWKDHEKLMKMIKLFLIDEVHILKESRGAALEAVVSRIKSSGCDVRFVALSATVPNIEDVAEWLGPARCEKFGEEFRPVKLEKHVYGYNSTGNDFAFDKTCETKLPGVIAKHSAGKPIMIFCCTRNSCISTAKLLANFWASARPQDRCWNAPGGQMIIENSDLRGTVTSGVAFHHAGLTPGDRHAVENGFLGNQLGVICCTSTLAVGVNLPCHLVIVKGTVSWQESGCREYPDLEMMQMLGRAGRPQFDDSAVGVILTRKERMSHYEKMVAGEERLESCLHLNLIDHLNAEIGLGTVYDIPSATRWLAGTFLFVRLKTNPDHYKLDGDTQAALDQDERLEEICGRDIKLLEETKLITVQGRIKSTELGDAMSRYYVKYKTMKTLLSLSRKASISEILSVLAQADEFHGVRLKSGERAVYKTLNKNNGIKYPIEVDIALSAHKISLIVQSELGGIDFPAEEQYKKHKTQYLQDKGIIFQHIHRLVRCIIDCQIHLQDAVTVRHALEFSRSLGARVWDNSPLELKQIETIGNVGVRRLVSANINSVETLEGTEARRIEMILSRYPPYGTRILTALKAFPKLRVRVKLMGKDVKPGIQVKVKVKAEISFMNEETPTVFRKRPIYVCFLVELSDGHLIDFRRISATKLQNTLDVFLSVDLWNEHQYITCSVMCDDIAGTYRTAQLQPGLPASIFPLPHNEEQSQIKGPDSACLRKPEMNISRRRSREGFCKAMDLVAEESENFFGDLDDQDLLAAENMEFRTIDDFEDRPPGRGFMATNPHTQKINKNLSSKPAAQESEEDALDYTQLSNGKWACNHKCKDKTSCKHMCCRDGLNKKPKPRKASSNTQAPKEIPKTSLGGKVTKPRTPLIQKPAPRRVATVGLANEPREEGLSGEGMNRLDSLWERLSDNNQVGKPMTCKKMLNDIPETVVAEAPKAASEVRQMDSVPATLLGATRSKNLKGWPKSPPTTPWDSYGTNPALLGMSDLPIQSECIPNKKVPAKILGSSNYYEDDLRDDLPLEEELLNTVQAHKLNDIPFLEAGIIGLEDSMARPNLEREQPQRFLKDYQAADDYGIMDWSSLNWSSSPIRDKRARSPSMASAIDRPNKRSLFVTGLSSDGVPSSQSPEKAVGKRPQEELWNIDLESGSETGYGKKKIEELNAIQDSSNEMREFRQSCASLKQHLERINSNPGWAKDFDIQEVELLSRKVEGVKLGTVVSRDLKKRIPPGSSAKAAFRDPFLELDVSKKNITDEGFLHLAQGLKEAFEYNGEQGKVIHLEELCLADNKISVISLDPLADIIKLAGDELEDLDLSGNEIKIESDQDGEIWERFLESFKFCSVLRRVDFSGSPLGPKAFEILARVYSKAETVDGFSSEGTSGEGNVEVITSDLDSTEAVAIEIPTARRHRGSTIGLYDVENSRETTMARYSSTRGIRSIPYMIFADTFMTDTCALHLSYIIAAHYPPHKLLRYVPPAKAGQPAQILDNYFQSGCLGIIYLPNANLSNNGQKLLDLAEQARVDEHEYSSIPESSQEAQPFPRSSRKGSGAGSHTDSNGSASGDSLETGRRRSNTSADPESPSTPYHAYIQNVSGELDRLRIRVQGLTLKEFGPESVELWRCGLKMLRLARTILLEGQRVEPEPEPQAPVLRIGPPKQTYASKLVASDATNKHPGEPIFGMVETSPRPRSPYTFTLAKGNNTSSASPSPTTLHSTRIKSDKRPLLLGFPLELWCQILAHAADAIGTISKEQQIGIVEWARDRESLGREMESLGKLESAQIWRVLDGMGCLAYDIRR